MYKNYISENDSIIYRKFLSIYFLFMGTIPKRIAIRHQNSIWKRKKNNTLDTSEILLHDYKYLKDLGSYQTSVFSTLLQLVQIIPRGASHHYLQ